MPDLTASTYSIVYILYSTMLRGWELSPTRAVVEKNVFSKKVEFFHMKNKKRVIFDLLEKGKKSPELLSTER